MSAAEEVTAESTVAAAQVDGSGVAGHGSTLQEPEFNVEVKLADLQADPNNPLFSAKSFEQLQLYVLLLEGPQCLWLPSLLYQLIPGPTRFSRASAR